MLFTIAIPTYNNQATIRKAVLSALNQDFDDDFEVLVVNNKSTDKTKQILKSIKNDKLRIIHNKRNVTMYANHNICLREAKGDYILFCHSDDILLKKALSVLKQKISERDYPSKYVVWGHSLFRDYFKVLIEFGWNINERIVGEFSPYIFVQRGLTPSGTCYSRESFVQYGGFFELKHRLQPSDSISMINIAFNGFIFEMIDDMYFERRNASTLSNVKDKERFDSFDEVGDLVISLYNDQIINELLFAKGKSIFSYYTYTLSRFRRYKILLLKSCILILFKNPYIVFNSMYRRTLLRIIFSWK